MPYYIAIQTRAPNAKIDDPGAVFEGWYNISDGAVVLTDRYGVALKDNDGKQYSRPIATTESAHAVAGRLVRKLRLARPSSGRAAGFNGPIKYPRYTGIA